MASWRYSLRLLALAAALVFVFAQAAFAGPALESLGLPLPPGPEERALEDLARRGISKKIPREELAVLFESFYNHRLPPAAYPPIFGVVEEAAEKELPVNPLILKIREGLAKGAPPEMVAAACRTRLNALEEGRNILTIIQERGTVPGHMQARAYMCLVSYLEAGMSPGGLARLARSPEVDSPHNLMHGARTLWRLNMVGLKEKEGLPLVRAALRENLRPFCMRIVVQETARRLRRGTPSERAADEVLGELTRIREFCDKRMGGMHMQMHMRMRRMR